MSPSTQSVYYIKTNVKRISFITAQSRTNVKCGKYLDENFVLPPDAHPIDKIEDNSFLITPSHQFILTKQTTIRTFDEYIQSLNEYDKTMLQNINHIQIETLIETINKGKKIIICSDGSTKANESGGAFIISDEEENILVTGHNSDTAHQWFQCSYRSEGQACASAFIYIHHLCNFLNLKKPQSVYYCDNKGLIMKLKTNCIITKKSSSQDILRIIKKIINPTETSFRHVKAHQDESNISLSYPEYLNCLVDKIANNNTTQTSQCTPDNTFSILHHHQYIPYKFDQYMRTHHHQDNAKRYISLKYKWNNDTYQDIDWTSHKKSIQNFPLYKKRQIVKYIHNYLPIGKLNFTIFNTCPYCGIRESDITMHHYQDHPFLCQRINKNKILENIQFDIFKLGLDNSTGKLIHTCLYHFFNNTKIDVTTVDAKHRQFIEKQNNIGWRHFIRGRVSSTLKKCCSFQNNASNAMKKEPTKYICQTIVSHLIQRWSKYATDRHDKDRDRSREIQILRDLLQESKRYNFSPNIRQMFQVDIETINESSLQSLQDRISHAKVLLRQAKSNSWLLPNNIKRYFGPRITPALEPADSGPNQERTRHVSSSQRENPRSSIEPQHSNFKPPSSLNLTRSHSHRMSSKKLIRRMPKSKKKIHTAIRMYNSRKNSPRTIPNKIPKISPKKMQEPLTITANSNESSTLRKKPRSTSPVEHQIPNRTQMTLRTSHIVREPEHRKKKLCMFYIP